MSVRLSALTDKRSLRDRMRSDIVHGRLRPGEVLRDLDLAARYGVSTSPVREVVAALALEQLIELPSHGVKRVALLDKQRSLHLLAVFRLLALHGYELGASRIEAPGVALMAEVLVRGRAEGDMSFSLFADFHDPVFVASGNPELRRMLALHQPWLQRLVILLIGRERPEHRMHGRADATLAALQAGKADAAVALFRESLDELQDQVERMPDIY